MAVIYILLPIALGFGALAIFVFAWAVRAGQFDDLETPAVRVVVDEETFEPGKPASSNSLH